MPQGVSVGSLVIEEKVHSSGSGDVLLARQPGLGRRVLVRTLRRDCLGNPDLVQRFRREARMAARVTHSNVQQVFDLFAWQGDHYLVLEHVEGESLRGCLDRLGSPPPAVALCLALELARGVEALHAAGIIHADLRAESARVGRWGEVKLGALGSARAPTERNVPAPDPNACTAPEVAAGSPPDARSDVYAFASMATEILGGGVLRLRRSRDLRRALLRATHADPGQRPGAGALRALLERALLDTAPATVRAQIAAWLVARPEEPAERPGAVPKRAGWRSSAAKKSALAGTAIGLIAAFMLGWDRMARELPVAFGLAPTASPPSVPPEPPSVDAGVPASSASLPQPARLRFAVFPWGEIRVDGGEAIVTPRAEPISLAPGLHYIEIAHPTRGSARREITLAAGEERTLRHVFDRAPVQ